MINYSDANLFLSASKFRKIIPPDKKKPALNSTGPALIHSVLNCLEKPFSLFGRCIRICKVNLLSSPFRSFSTYQIPSVR